MKNAEELLEQIPNKTRNLLGIVVDVNLTKSASKELIEISVEPYSYPISYKGQYHYRSGSTKQVLKGTALDQFLLGKQGKCWDGVPVPGVKVGEFDKLVIDRFRDQALAANRLSRDVLKEPNSQLLDKLHLREGTYFKRAAVLLFHPEPETFVTGAYIKIGYFESNANLLYQDEIHGDLLSQADQVVDILKTKYMRTAISFEGLQRIESYPVPDQALREALLNAVVHKDYSSANPIQISVYPEQLTLWNPGKLPENWTVDRLRDKHPSQPFNPDIANTFFRAGLIEAWGTGIERMLNACKAAKIPDPEFKVESTGLGVAFRFNEAFAQEIARERVNENRGENRGENQGKNRGKNQRKSLINSEESRGENRGENRGKSRGENRGKKHQKIIAAMRTNPRISAASLANELGVGPDNNRGQHKASQRTRLYRACRLPQRRALEGTEEIARVSESRSATL